MTAALPDADLVRRSGYFDAAWYAARYPDVARGRHDALTHFLQVGGPLGRDPGPGFDSRAYLAAYPDVAQSGQVALLHYLRGGRAEGRRPQPPAAPTAPDPALARVAYLRGLLETGGLDAAPLAALARHAQDLHQPAAAAQAAEVLGLWALWRKAPRTARAWFDHRLRIGADPATLARLAPMQLLAASAEGDRTAAQQILDLPLPTADLALAATWLDTDPEARLMRINSALPEEAPIRLCDGATPAFDRLEAQADPEGQGPDAPLVSVLMAAHDAAATIDAALRSVMGQSWQALELLVIDDASTDTTADRVACAAVRDPRIRLIRLPANLGAYGARNAGLAQARGAYVTLLDADDWAHPARIARQVHHLITNPGDAGCMTRQIRCTDDLRVSRWTGTGAILHENLASLMLPAGLLRDTLGSWDQVRVSADSELLRRVHRLFGRDAVPVLASGPLTLQRDSAASATADSATGMGWFYYGARRDYYEAQLAHHQSGSSLRYDAEGPRPFAAPAILHPGFDRASVQRVDHVYAGVFADAGAPLAQLLDWLDADLAAGRSAALVPLYDAAAETGGALALPAPLRTRVDGKYLRVLCYGERADCARFHLLSGPPTPRLRYLPQVWENGQPVLAPDPGPPPPVPMPAPAAELNKS